MGKVPLTKGSLQKEKQHLRLYNKLLPSLELKRTQLRAEHMKAKAEVENYNKKESQLLQEMSEKLPMLANRDVDLKGLVKIQSIQVAEQSVVGVKVPLLKEIVFDLLDYSLLAKPHWVDAYVESIKKLIELRIKMKLMNQRVEKLGQAVRRITQHVNLFEKILIPNAKKIIQKIQIILGDAERTSIVRSKMTKALHK